MRFTITVTSGPHKGEQFTLPGKGAYLIGRKGTALALPQDERCSAQHVRIDADPPHFHLTDLGSLNGTRVNGRLVQTTALQAGDHVNLGKTELCITLLEESETAGPGLPDIPGFTVERKLASTITGTVYRARWVNDGKLVAVKRPDTLGGSLNARLKREAGLLESIRHPHVLRFCTSGMAGNRFVYATEYTPSIDLRCWLQREGPRPIAEAIGVIRQVLATLSWLHAQGILHRNLTPSNVWLSGEPGRRHVWLTDFSLARFVGGSVEPPPWLDLSQITLVNEQGGTPSFVPPEQAMDLHSVTAAGDQYAAAALLYFLLTGHAPYTIPPHAENPFDVVLEVDPTDIHIHRKDLPLALEAAILTALKRDPRSRHATLTDLDAALTPFAA